MAFSHDNKTDRNDNTVVTPYQRPSFVAFSSATAIGNNKSMISITNTSSQVVRIEKIFIINSQTTAITGIISTFEFRRITSHSLGTAITAISFDTQDTLDAGITIRTGSTVVGEGSIMQRRIFSSDEWGVGTQDNESLQHSWQSFTPLFNNKEYMKPLTIRQNQGFHIKHATNSTAGTFDIVIEFTADLE